MLSGWVIGLAIVTALGTLVSGVMFMGSVLFADFDTPVVVSSPRDCRLSEDQAAPKLFLAVDVTAISYVYGLDGASPINARGRKVERVAVVRSLPPLSELDDAEFLRILREGEENPSWFRDDVLSGVLVASVDTGEASGSLGGLKTRWSLGEPAAAQDLPLGIEFTRSACTVTRTK
ncbi:hypothetical protein ACFM35_00905 [Microbacterium sp. P01]|uniref:hypothetical protein n=1 Tax=Microbacterium sp. P01 TaxID=3366261 RepID=UPI0036709A36